MSTPPTTLPRAHQTPVLRTDFSDGPAWERLRTALTRYDEDGFRAYVEFVDDPAYRDLTPQRILALAPREYGHPIVIVADGPALASPELPLLVLDLVEERGRTVRVIAEELWSIENNVAIANMFFAEFVAAADEDGVFRGF